MLSVPLPIVVALMLLVVMLVNREALLNQPRGRWFLALLVIYCIVLVLIGIRWTSDTVNVMPFLPVLAVVWCILTWIAFRSLSRDGPAIDASDWPHLLPVIGVIVALFATPVWLEVVIVSCNLFYAALLIRLAKRGSDALRIVKFGSARNCHRAVWITAVMLIYFAVIEIVIALDFGFFGGRHAAAIVTLANVPTIFLLGLAAAGAGQASSSEESQSAPAAEADVSDKSADSAPDTDTDQAELMQQLTTLLVDDRLYEDTELNLQRLARKAGVPARQVSRAVNRHAGLNVSQWVNEARIRAACALLRQSDATVLEIMQKVGFATKSNFNREFRRITGASPSAWRVENADS
jgi:AraC-like DNA-binding protein